MTSTTAAALSLKLGKYHYQVLVTNLPLQPLNLWRFYNDQAALQQDRRDPKKPRSREAVDADTE